VNTSYSFTNTHIQVKVNSSV